MLAAPSMRRVAGAGPLTDLVLHVIPYDGVGGVEQAAASAEGATADGFVLRRLFVFPNVGDRRGRFATFNPFALWSAAGRVAASRPKLVIVSLWRSAIVSWLAGLRGCRAQRVLFLHNARDAHLADKITTRLTARRSAAIWADSQATISQRLPIRKGLCTRVISYLPARIVPARMERPDPTPDFIFWGRLAPQKDLLAAVRFFAKLRDRLPNATLTIIGPDGGARQALVDEIARLDLGSSVELAGPLVWEDIAAKAARCSFYLQTSKYEGMALSVVEAMQVGLVPVVRPVGEIANYTEDGKSAIWLPEDEDANEACVEKVLHLISGPDCWRKIRASAVAVWKDQPLYRDDIIAAAKDVLQNVASRAH